MTVDELKQAKDRLAENVIALAKDFEMATSVKVKELYLNIPLAVTGKEGKYTMAHPSETSCVVDLAL